MSFSGTSSQSEEPDKACQDRGFCYPPAPLSTPDGVLHRHHSLGLAPQQGSVVVSPTVSKDTTKHFPDESPAATGGETITQMVDFPHHSQGPQVQRTTLHDSDNSPRLLHGTGSVDSGGSEPQYQFIRAPGDTPNPQSLQGRGQGLNHFDSDRQCGRQGTCLPPRRDPFLGPNAGSQEVGPLGGDSSAVHTGST